MVDEAKNMPLSSDKCVLERDRALDLIDDIRAQFPVELGEAKKLVASRNDYIAAAKREAEVIRKRGGGGGAAHAGRGVRAEPGQAALC